MNGTCYTAEECSSRDGIASGECADGYGVCCVITLSCGASSNENGTYLSQAASTTPSTDSTTSQSCTYTICPRTAAVSRIRLDLTTFLIGGPYAAATDGSAGNSANAGSAIGQCRDDSFSVTGAPVICGTNTGQHMIVDTDGSTCVTAAFSYGLSTTQSRSYTIQVTQYESTNEMGGPAGCLQFYTGLTGTVNTFNWVDSATSTHLANQNYDVCVRAAIDRCVICWAPIGALGTNAIRGNFGISNAMSTDGNAKSGVGVQCPNAANNAADSDDFVLIPGGQTEANAIAAALTVGNDKYCGRFLNVATNLGTDSSVCSRVTPFTLGVRFDDFEVTMAGAAAMELDEEASGTAASASPLGTQGFSLGFSQVAC